jgi:hypothetical protein
MLPQQERSNVRTRRLSWAAATMLVAAIVLWQAASCCRLGGATPPPVTPMATSEELAQQLRDRINQVTSHRGTFSVEITDQELTSYVVGRLQSGPGDFPARDMQIRFREGYVEIWATFIDIAPTELPVYIRATVQAVDGQLVFQITQASAARFSVPGAVRETISQILSETLAEMNTGLQVERVAVEPGRVLLSGQVIGDVPSLP